MKQKILARSLILGALAAVVPILVDAAPAQASFSWSHTERSITIGKGEQAGRKFWVHFNGIVNGKVVPGLTSTATFTLLEAFNGTVAKFRINLENTSMDPITASRVSILGFDVDQKLGGVTISDPDVDGSGGDGANIFTVVASGQTAQPKFAGELDLCLKAGGPANNCTSGGGNGVFKGLTQTFNTTLTLAATSNSITFRNCYARYQSIDGTIGNQIVAGESGIGVGEVPTPALIPGAIGMGIAALRKRKRQSQAESEESKELSEVS